MAQQVVVADNNTKEPLPYATIVFSQERKGIYADNSGKFTVPLQYNATDSVNISILGYHTKYTLVINLHDTVYLEQKAYELPTVTILPKDKNIIKLGNIKSKRNGYFGMSATFTPVVIASYISNTHYENCYIEKLYFKYLHQKDGFSYLVRPQLFEVGGNGEPAAPLLSKSTTLILPEKGGILEIDVSNEFIVFPENGLFVGMEIIEPVNVYNKKNVKEELKRLIPIVINNKKRTTSWVSWLNDIQWINFASGFDGVGYFDFPFGLSIVCDK